MSSALNQDTIDTPPRDAATVILIRDANQGLEVLLLRRGNSKTVMSNAWVFPGGKLDDADFGHAKAVTDSLTEQPHTMLAEPELSPEHAAAIFFAGCRETEEETGVVITADQLYPWSRWITPTTPSLMKKRFDARFFIAKLPPGQTAVHDGQEATASVWYSAKDALRAYFSNEINLVPPQIMTLAALARHNDTMSCINYAKTHAPYSIQPGVVDKTENGRTMVYPGDAEHPIKDKHMPGPTRLVWSGNHFEPPNGFDGFFED